MTQDDNLDATTGMPDSSPISEDVLPEVRREFDADWYDRTYAADIHRLKEADEDSFDFYVRIGARMGHDPNERFSEILYRLHNADVRGHVAENADHYGFRHYLEYGVSEPSRIRFTRQEADNARLLLLSLDRDFLRETYGAPAHVYPDIVDFYFDRVRSDMLSPAADFSEAGYFELNPDVADEVEAGRLSSGFEHFLLTRGDEERAIISHADHLAMRRAERDEKAERETRTALEASLPGITHLTALDMLNAMEFFDSTVDVTVAPATGTRGLLVLVPHFLPEILFGGYMAFYDFLGRLKSETGIRLHLLVVNTGSRGVHANNLLRMRLKMPGIHALFDDFQRFDPASRTLTIPGDFEVMSYCAELHRMAARVAGRLKRKPIFFIQEFEPDFHANTDMRSFTESAFLLPHHAIYNSAKLVEYFRERTQVFTRAGPDYRFCSIENAISAMPLERGPYLRLQREKTSRRLIMYGRPEGHAARNHFATLVFALRQATRCGVFRDEAWEFVAIGSLSFRESIDLNGASKLRMLPKMPKAEYEDYLLSGDIGVSVITTPHPGIVHFQMAAFGLTTLTNRTGLRDEAWLAAQNRNLVPVEMTGESIVEGFRRAVAQAEDVEARYDNALSAKRVDPDACLRPALDMVADIVCG